MLLQVQELGNNQSGRAQSGVAARDGSSHHAEQGKDAAEESEPVFAHHGHHLRGCHSHLGSLPEDFLSGSAVEEIHRYRCPDECHDTLGDHGAVENGATHLFRLHAAGHERALSGMETTDGTAGNRDEECREYGCAVHRADAVGQLGQRGPLDEEHGHQRHSHEKH